MPDETGAGAVASGAASASMGVAEGGIAGDGAAGNAAVNDEAHAATVLYAKYPPNNLGDSTNYLSSAPRKEFRGHATVIERVYDGGTTGAALLRERQSWFYQGNSGSNGEENLTCSPLSGSTLVTTSTCFTKMKQYEGLKGRAYKEETRNGSTVLSRTLHTFTRLDLPFYGSDSSDANYSNNYQRAGLWRAFNPEIESHVLSVEGTGTPLDKKTTYAYDGYGNVATRDEYTQASSLFRRSEYFYNTRIDATSYIVDRLWGEDTRDGNGLLLSLTQYFYDGLNTTITGMGSAGDLTRVAKYYNVPLAANAKNVLLYGQDTTYTYNTPTNTPAGTTSRPTNTPTRTPTPTNTPAGATNTPTNTPSSGTRLKDITFEGGSLTDATTGVDSTSGTVLLTAAAPLKGSYSATVPTTATGYLAESFSSVGDLYISFYLKASSFPATSRLVQIRDSASTTIGGLYLNSSGTLTLKNGSTTIGTSSALSANTLYRIGIRQGSGSGTGVLQAYLATGDAAFGTAFASSTSETIANPAAEVRLGATNSSAVDVTVDDIRLDSSIMPGPSGSGSATATPTNTPTGPTATPTRTATPTNTPVGPTNTPTATNTPIPAPPAYDESYAYDAIGNMTSKAGVTRAYGANGNGTGSGPHQARTVGGQTYSYDANGNLLSGSGRTYAWTPDNLVASVGGETYTYDADGERVAKTAGGVTTVYFQGVWEQVVGGASKLYYTFNGQVVAMRDTSTNTVTYLHGDHLGSISLTTSSSGAVLSRQDFDPWGASVRRRSTTPRSDWTARAYCINHYC